MSAHESNQITTHSSTLTHIHTPTQLLEVQRQIQTAREELTALKQTIQTERESLASVRNELCIDTVDRDLLIAECANLRREVKRLEREKSVAEEAAAAAIAARVRLESESQESIRAMEVNKKMLMSEIHKSQMTYLSVDSRLKRYLPGGRRGKGEGLNELRL